MLFQCANDHLKDALQILALPNGAGDPVEQFEPAQLRLDAVLGALALDNLGAERFVRREQRAIPLLDTGQQFIEGAGQLAGFIPSLRRHADGEVLVGRDLSRRLRQGKNGLRNRLLQPFG